MSHSSSCSKNSGYHETPEGTSRTVSKDGKNCTQYGTIHHQICSECDNEIGSRTTWGQTDCP